MLGEEGVLDRALLGVTAMVAFGYREAESAFPRTRHSIDNIVKWVK